MTQIMLLEAGAAAGGGLGGTLMMMAAMLLLLYFMVMRPQKKREKEQSAMRSSLDIGDEITSIGGIIGTIVSKRDDHVVIETAGDRNKIRLATWAIQQNNSAIERASEEAAAKSAAKSAKK